MDGAGGRLGRSSTRYGPSTIFSGPVRKWQKRWAPAASSANAATGSSKQTASRRNGIANGVNSSSLLFFKWTPLHQANIKDSSDNHADVNYSDGPDKEAIHLQEESPSSRRRFRYVPAYLMETERKLEDIKMVEDEAMKLGNGNDVLSTVMPNPDHHHHLHHSLEHHKPSVLRIVNDGLSQENDKDNKSSSNSQVVRQDLNERAYDLSLGTKSPDNASCATEDHHPSSSSFQR